MPGAGGLPLHSSRPAASDQLLHFLPRTAVEIARNRMLEAGRSDGESQGFLVAWQVKQSEDQSAREAVAASHAIHDMGDFVMAAEQKLAAIVQACGPAVVRRALRFAQCDGQHLQ